MRNLGTLYLFELKKIFSKRLTWITAAVMLIICMFSASFGVLGSYYVDGVKVDTHYNMMETDRAYERALTGRKIDQQLLSEMQRAYAQIPAEADRYSITEEYQLYARPYSAIFNIARWATGITIEEIRDWQADEQAYYAARDEIVEEGLSGWRLTEQEKEFWRQKEREIEKPMVFAYREGYTVLMEMVYTVNLMVQLLIGICLVGVFADEHTRRTDQLLLAAKLGKKELYRAKMLAGISFAAICALFFSVAVAACTLAIYGTDGFSAALQLSRPDFSWPLSMGQAVLIQYGLLLITGVMVSALVMMLSELLHNGVGTLAVLFGILLLPMFVSIPEQYRAVSQLFSYFPGELVSVWSTFNVRLVKVFGLLLTAWQAAPVLYLILTAAFCLIGGRAYRRYQVSGR